ANAASVRSRSTMALPAKRISAAPSGGGSDFRRARRAGFTAIRRWPTILALRPTPGPSPTGSRPCVGTTCGWPRDDAAVNAGQGQQQALQQATALHQAGGLADAGRGYRAVLDATPDDPRALQLLGVIALQPGHLEQAEPLLRRALAREPHSAETC